MRHYLGIDGGGSKCDAVLIDETGTVLGWGHAGATSYQSTEASTNSVQQAVEAALEGQNVTDLSIGSLWVANDLVEFLGEMGISATCRSVFEWDASFAAAERTWGILALSGTGSWVQGRTPDGRMLRLGGLGPILGDEGGGWDLGLRGIKAALRAKWSPQLQTTLGEAVPEAMGYDSLLLSVVGLPITSGQITRAQIAAVAPVVLREAVAGDRIALDIVHKSAEHLSEYGRIVIEDLGVVGEGYPLLGVAGLLQGSQLYWDTFCEHILRHDSTLQPEVVPTRIAVGAVLKLMQNDGIDTSKSIHARVLETQQAFPDATVYTK